MKEILFTIAIFSLFLVSCHKESEELEHWEVVITNYHYNYVPATYINLDTAVVYRENLPDTGYTSALLNSKVVFDRENSISIRYVGGHHDYSYIDCGIPTTVEPDPDKKYIFDTVYTNEIVNISYAIFELTEKNRTWRDTVVYYKPGLWGTPCEHEFADLDTTNTSLVEPYIKDLFYKYSDSFMDTNDYYNDLILLQLPNKRQSLYMMDIFPYWADPINYAYMVIFFK